jgi:hypothetical protein
MTAEQLQAAYDTGDGGFRPKDMSPFDINPEKYDIGTNVGFKLKNGKFCEGYYDDIFGEYIRDNQTGNAKDDTVIPVDEIECWFTIE